MPNIKKSLKIIEKLQKFINTQFIKRHNAIVYTIDIDRMTTEQLYIENQFDCQFRVVVNVRKFHFTTFKETWVDTDSHVIVSTSVTSAL